MNAKRPGGTWPSERLGTHSAPTHGEQWRTTPNIVMADNIEVTTQYTPTHRARSKKGHHHNGSIHKARGRFLMMANKSAPYVIFSRGKGLNLGWASFIAEPRRPVTQLLDLLASRNSRLLAVRKRNSSFPALLSHAAEKNLLAQRRRLLGTPSYGNNILDTPRVNG